MYKKVLLVNNTLVFKIAVGHITLCGVIIINNTKKKRQVKE